MGIFSKAQLVAKLLVASLALIITLQGATIWLLATRPATCAAASIDAPSPLP